MSCIIDAVTSEVRNYPNHYLNVAARSVFRHIKDEQHRWKESSGLSRIPIALKLLLYGCATPVGALAVADNACVALVRKASGRPFKYANCHEVISGLYLGNVKAANDVAYLRRMNIDCVVSLYPVAEDYPADIEHCKVMIKDRPHVSLGQSIEDSMHVLDKALKQGRRVLVHCHHGASRSAAIVIAYLMLHRGMSYRQALELCRRRRVTVRPNVGFREQLKQLEAKPTRMAHPGDWENLRVAAVRPLDARGLRVIDGLFHPCRKQGNAGENLATLKASLERIARVPKDSLDARQQRSLQQAQRILTAQGERSWFYSLRTHAAWARYADYQALNVHALPESEGQAALWKPSASFRCCSGPAALYGEQPAEELSRRCMNHGPAQTTQLASNALSVYWPGGKSCLLHLAGQALVFDPDFQPGAIESPAKLTDCHPDAVILSGQKLPSGPGSEYLLHIQSPLLVPAGLASAARRAGYRHGHEFAAWERAQLGDKITVTRLPTRRRADGGGWALEADGQSILYLADRAWSADAAYDSIRKHFPKPQLIITTAQGERALDVAEFFDAEQVVITRWDGDLGRYGDGLDGRRLEEALAKRPELWGKVHVPLIGENYSP